jgi:hypothetical protein
VDVPYGDFLKICVCVVCLASSLQVDEAKNGHIESGQGNIFTKAKEPTK